MNNIASKLIGRDWRRITENAKKSERYCFIEDSRLIVTDKGVILHKKWSVSMENSLIIVEGIVKRYYYIVYIDDNILVLHLEDTPNYIFLIDSTSPILGNVGYKEVEWYLIQQFGKSDHKVQDTFKIEEKQGNIFIEGQKEKLVDHYSIIVLIVIIVIEMIIFGVAVMNYPA